MSTSSPITPASWVQALKSGQYIQIDGRLYRGDDQSRKEMCCLGVLADIMGVTWQCMDGEYYFEDSIGREIEVDLPDPVRPDWLSYTVMQDLIDVNDESAKRGFQDYSEVIPVIEKLIPQAKEHG